MKKLFNSPKFDLDNPANLKGPVIGPMPKFPAKDPSDALDGLAKNISAFRKPNLDPQLTKFHRLLAYLRTK